MGPHCPSFEPKCLVLARRSLVVILAAGFGMVPDSLPMWPREQWDSQIVVVLISLSMAV